MKILYSFVILLFMSAGNILAGDIDVSSLTKLLGSSNMGREFYFTFIPAASTIPECELKIYISSSVRTKVILEVPGKGYEKIKYTIPNDIIEFTLSPPYGQCYRISGQDPPKPDQIWRDAGVHVVADDPIICYCVTRFYASTDAFLALPINVLGKEYIVSSFADPANNISQWLPSYTGITAAYDKTIVWFTMGGTILSKTAGGLEPGKTSTWNLNKGDVLLIASKGQYADLSGSKVSSSKPVSVVSGNACANIPANCGCCDFIEEMEIPTHTWGQTYHVTPIIGRNKSSIIKIFAREDNTVVYKDHMQIGIIRKAGGVEGTGYLHLRADSSESRPVVISGEKPISVTQFNTGQQDDNIVSDPFQMVLLPVEQYQKEITFNTPGIRGGYGFPYNYINICYESDTSGNIPDDIEIAFYNDKDSVFDWYKLNDKFSSKGTTFANYEFGKQYSSTTFKLPADGVYKLKADKPFQAYSYGFSDYDSYGHPASASLKRMDIIDTLPPNPRWTLDCDGNVNVKRINYVEDNPSNPKEGSGLSLAYMLSDLSYNYKFSMSSIMPCEISVAEWKLEIIDNSQDARAVVTFADCAGNDTTIIIEYEAVKFAIEPKIVDFGLNDVNVVKDKMFYVVNQSKTKTSQVNFLKLKRNNQNFTLLDSNGINHLPSEFNPPIALQPLDTFAFIIRFATATEGEYWDSIGIGDTCNFQNKGYVSAMAGTPIIDVTDWDFPPTQIGNTAYGQFDIKNKGTVTLEIYDYVGPFITGNVHGQKIYVSEELEALNISPSNPLRLKPAETRTFQVKFTPDEEKSYPDSIVFISNSIKDPQLNNGNPIDSITRLTGTGVKSDLIVTSYNWERKRIHRTNFPAGPYHAIPNITNPDTAIKIYNGATAPLTIIRLIYTECYR